MWGTHREPAKRMKGQQTVATPNDPMPAPESQKIRYPKEGCFNSHIVLPPVLCPAHRGRSTWRPTLDHAFGFIRPSRGIIDGRHWASTLLDGLQDDIHHHYDNCDQS